MDSNNFTVVISNLPLSPSFPSSLLQERAAFHRQQLRQKLGLVAQGKVFSTGIEKLFEDSDLLLPTGSEGSPKSGNGGRQQKVCRIHFGNKVVELCEVVTIGMTYRHDITFVTD